MVSRVQARVVQQGLPERRVTARSARPSTLALLGRPLSSAEAHRFLLVGGGHQYVMTLITRIGIREDGGGPPALRRLWRPAVSRQQAGSRAKCWTTCSISGVSLCRQEGDS